MLHYASRIEELNTNKIAGFKFVDKIEYLVSFTEVKNKLCILSPETKELEQAYRLKDIYKLSLVDCEYIVLARSKNAVLLTDDSYLARAAFKEGIEKIYDLKSLLEFSEKNLKELFARFQQT